MFLSPSTSQNGGISQDFSSGGVNPLLVSQAQQTKQNRNLLIGAIVAMVVLIIVGIVMIITRETSKAPVAPAVNASPSATWERIGVLHLETTPSGAMVEWAGKKVCHATPCDITFRGDEADPEKEHRLMISRDGYQPEVKAVKVSDRSVSVTLLEAVRPDSGVAIPH
jgi:hypothetical protein